MSETTETGTAGTAGASQTDLDVDLDAQVAELALRDLPLAREILAECIRIPADHVDRPVEEGGDPRCGLSGHEGPRLDHLRRKIVEIGAVRRAGDVWFDAYGNLVWTVDDPDDGIADDDKTVVWLDGHTDTVDALRPLWRERLGAIDAYDGLLDELDDRGSFDPGTDVDVDTDDDTGGITVDRDALRAGLGHLPPDEEWGHLVFGRGSADQLAGVVAQVVATRILLELAPLGALRGVIVRSYATVSEEDNDGGGPRYVMRHELPGAPAAAVPDVVILTEGTGDAAKGALGIYRGQRGRMQIEVTVTGRSSHGSMPWEGLNALEHGAAIVAEAAERADAGDGFRDDPFLGRGSRTASWSSVDTPSDCAVPERFTFRFDRRLTVGESPEQAVADVDGLDAVRAAREAGLTVDVGVPVYDGTTWTGYRPGNPQVYPGWATPEGHPAIGCAVDVYRRVVAPHVGEDASTGGGGLRREPRVDRWIFSTDGVGYPVPAADVSTGTIAVPVSKRWVDAGTQDHPVRHPAMFGVGPGIEQNTHKVGECVDDRELRLAIAFLARFPSAYADHTSGAG
jgi:acetylornithine deacetylase/succinyl-diaminopimelate desuccinylase-like protein